MMPKSDRRLAASRPGAEIRLADMSGVDVRAAADGSPIPFTGHAAVFNSRALIGGKWGFYEEVMPGAFDSALERGDDVRLLKNHNEDLILARTTAGNLRLSVDAVGLVADADMTPTTYAKDLALSLAAGDVTQMSYAFRVLRDEWSVVNVGGPDERELRQIFDVELFDCSPVTYPAFADTDASLRMREMDLVCRSLGADDPTARHHLVRALAEEPDNDLAVSLRAAAMRLADGAATSRASDEQEGGTAADDRSDAARRHAYLARKYRITAA
jgi:uncharacterized protein